MKALVIVHPSSIDSYTHMYGEDAAARLSHRIYEAARVHEGPVFLLDQQWVMGPESGPRRALYNSLLPIYLQKDVSVLPFDEVGEEWSEYLRSFREQLLDMGVSEVVLGGLWHDLDMGAGAVVDAYKIIGEVIPTSVDENMVAFIPGSRRV